MTRLSKANALQIQEKQYTAEVLSLTTKLLAQNPEYYTIWNYRRLIQKNGLFRKSKSPLSNWDTLSSPQELASDISSSEALSIKQTTSNETSTESSVTSETLEFLQNDLNFLIPL